MANYKNNYDTDCGAINERQGPGNTIQAIIWRRQGDAERKVKGKTAAAAAGSICIEYIIIISETHSTYSFMP